MGNKPIFHGITFRVLHFFWNEVKGCSSQHSLLTTVGTYRVFSPSEALLRLGRVHISNNIRFHDQSQIILESMRLGSLHFLPSILSSLLSSGHHQRHSFFSDISCRLRRWSNTRRWGTWKRSIPHGTFQVATTVDSLLLVDDEFKGVFTGFFLPLKNYPTWLWLT